MIMALVAGFSALLGWHNVFLTGFVTLPSLIAVIFLLPNVPKAEEKIKQEALGAPGSKKLSIQTVVVSCYIFLFGIPFAVYIINSAMLLSDQLQLGPEVAGVTSAITGIASIVGGIVYNPIARALKSHLLWFGTAIVCAGLALEYFCTNFTMFLIGACLVLFGFVFTFAGAIHSIPIMGVPANQVAFGISVVMGLQSLASMLTPYVINPIGKALYGAETASNNYKVAMIWALVVTVIGIIWAIVNAKHYKVWAENNKKLKDSNPAA
jgi:hypothetical protein